MRAGNVRDAKFGNIPIKVDGYEQRLIRNVVEGSPDTDVTTGEAHPTFEYDTVQTDLTTGSTVVRTWRVRTGAPSESPADVIVHLEDDEDELAV